MGIRLSIWNKDTKLAVGSGTLCDSSTRLLSTFSVSMCQRKFAALAMRRTHLVGFADIPYVDITNVECNTATIYLEVQVRCVLSLHRIASEKCICCYLFHSIFLLPHTLLLILGCV